MQCTSDLLDLLVSYNGTVLYFNYELICYISYIIVATLDKIRVSVEILELGLKTGEAPASSNGLDFGIWIVN